MRRRRALKLSLCLALGLLTSVAVAWGCKAYHYANFYPTEIVDHGGHYIERDGEAWHTLYWRGRGRASYRVRSLGGSAKADVHAKREDHRFFILELTGKEPEESDDFLKGLDQEPVFNSVPWWVELPPDDPAIDAVFSSGYGWPRPCLMSRLENPDYGERHSYWSWTPPIEWRPTRPRPFGRRPQIAAPFALPVYPIWTGVVADTAVYGLLWWTLLFAPWAARRRWRRRRGRCMKCGYDLAGVDRCPECGWIPQGRGTDPLPTKGGGGESQIT